MLTHVRRRWPHRLECCRDARRGAVSRSRWTSTHLVDVRKRRTTTDLVRMCRWDHASRLAPHRLCGDGPCSGAVVASGRVDRCRGSELSRWWAADRDIRGGPCCADDRWLHGRCPTCGLASRAPTPNCARQEPNMKALMCSRDPGRHHRPCGRTTVWADHLHLRRGRRRPCRSG